jgi:hypothetical protein
LFFDDSNLNKDEYKAKTVESINVGTRKIKNKNTLPMVLNKRFEISIKKEISL